MSPENAVTDRRKRNRQCMNCGKPFAALRMDARTCSPACRQAAYRYRQWDRVKRTRMSWSTAIHEAGHMVAACVCEKVTHRLGVPNTGGALASIGPVKRYRFRNESERAFRFAVICMAGPVAQARFCKQSLTKVLKHNGSVDLEQATWACLGMTDAATVKAARIISQYEEATRTFADAMLEAVRAGQWHTLYFWHPTLYDVRYEGGKMMPRR